MSKFLFTMLPANDLGLPTRLLPVARILADRGHDVAVFNPAPAPAKLIEETGLKNLPVPPRPMPNHPPVMADVSQAWDVEQLFAGLFSNEELVRAATAMQVDLMNDFKPDVVVDSFGPFGCLAARALKIPLVSILQGNFHPASEGFKWWAGERPKNLPTPVAYFNTVAAEYGLGPFNRTVELLAGDLSLIVGTPETDPVAGKNITHVGPIVWQRGNAHLPEWVNALNPVSSNNDKPIVWVYAGNPRYAGAAASTPCDSIVVIRAAIAALADAPMHVVLTTGHQEFPAEFGTLPANFHNAAYLPGREMAERSALMVHHGGHSSVMSGLAAGTPAVIIPTMTERESNARRLTALGAGEIVLPVETADGDKQIDVADFSAKVHRVLNDASYTNAAQKVAASMRNYGGAIEAADRIEKMVRS